MRAFVAAALFPRVFPGGSPKGMPIRPSGTDGHSGDDSSDPMAFKARGQLRNIIGPLMPSGDDDHLPLRQAAPDEGAHSGLVVRG